MFLFDIFLYIVLPLIAFGFLFLKKKFSYFAEQGIPHPKPSWTMGNMNGVGKTIHFFDLIKNNYLEYKDKDVIAGLYMMSSPSILALDLELVKLITIKDFNNFMNRGLYVNDDEALTGNLFQIDGDKWRFLRNKLSPVFTSGKIKMMYNTISDKGKHFIKAIEEASKSGSVNIKDISNRFTIDTVSSCAFGMEANTLMGEHNELTNIFKKIFGEEAKIDLNQMIIFAFPKLAKLLRLKQFTPEVTNFFTDVISGSINDREANNVVRNDFLNMLIELKNKGSIDGEFSTETRKLTMNECVAQGFVFFLAGADTSSTTVAFALIEIAMNEEIQVKIRREIKEKTKETNGEITYENLHEMTYLNQVVNESLRKYPTNFVTIRQAINDYPIPNSKHIIKAGTQVQIPVVGFHHDEKYYPNPDVFDPDRFTVEEIAKRPASAYMPFGDGPRNCIGMRFAQLNVKLGIANVIKHFNITLDDSKTQLPLKLDPKSPVLVPIGGFWLKCEKV